MRIKRRCAFTIVELLAVIAIMGLLAGLLLPAINNSREAARAAQCKSNLHQISLATELFHNSYQSYPPARYQPRPDNTPDYNCGGAEATWLVRILPFLDESPAVNNWSLSRPYASHADAVRSRSLGVYCCPSRRTVGMAFGLGAGSGTIVEYIKLPCGCKIRKTIKGSQGLLGAVGDYGGNHGDMSPGSLGLPSDLYYGGNGSGVIITSNASCENGLPVNWTDKISHASVTDGLSNTFLAGEMHVPIGTLRSAPGDAFIFDGDEVFDSARLGGPTLPIVSDLRDQVNGLVSWGSWHYGYCQFAMADGSICAISTAIDTETLGNLCNRKDDQRDLSTIE